MDYATTRKPNQGKSKRLKKKKVAPRKGGYFFAQKFSTQTVPTQTFNEADEVR